MATGIDVYFPPFPPQERFHVAAERAGTVLAGELVHAGEVGEYFAEDPLPECALVKTK